MKKMHIKHIQNLIELREILGKKLYSGQSLITYDLILEILQAHLNGQSITIKELCAGSIRSTLNTRKHLNLLQDDGWIIFTNGIHDKRLRMISPTNKLIRLVDEILEKYQL
jgi:DNA-binding transcriptional regulator GbsR (MarR family)